MSGRLSEKRGGLIAVFGTRPEAIKMCPLIIKMREAGIGVEILLSGQHKEMANEVLGIFGLEPYRVIAIERDNDGLSELTCKLLSALSAELEARRPCAILVHGDTATAFCASLAGFYLGIDVIHIEAGLRSGDLKNPFPEELYRSCIGKIASLHFAPTEVARNNLIKEGISEDKIFVTGNTVIDAFKYTLNEDYIPPWGTLWADSKLILLTAHRRESLDGAIFDTLLGVRDALESSPDAILLFPIHKNPKVIAAAEKIFGSMNRAILCPPLSVFDFHNTLKLAAVVVTDSGGVQEEAAYLGKPTLVIRECTERGEGVLNSSLLLVGRKREVVFANLLELLHSEEKRKSFSLPTEIFGDGLASERITEILRKFYLK